jgi:hypothetical protein
VIVDHIENHHKPELVRTIDEGLRIFRSPIQPGRREEIDAIIAPAKSARKVGNRHDFDQRNSKARELRELLHGRPPSAFRSKRSKVQFVCHQLVCRPTPPCPIRPREGRVDDLRRTMRSIGLKARRRIGIRTVVEFEAVEGAGLRLRDEAGVITVLLRLEREGGWHAGLAHQFHGDRSRSRGPGSKVRACARNPLRANGKVSTATHSAHVNPCRRRVVSDRFPVRS